jgi:hypothetical protein
VVAVLAGRQLGAADVEAKLEPSDTYSGIYEHFLRDIMYLHKIPKRGIKSNCSLY